MINGIFFYGEQIMKITFFGTTTLLFDDGTDQVLFDAHVTRPSLMKYICGREASNTALADELIKLHNIDRLRAIFVSHSHHDHVMDVPHFAKKSGAAVYGSSSALNVCRGGGVPEEQLIEFQANETYTVGNYRIKVIPSIHSKPTILNNDLGQTIDSPLSPNAKLRDYKEGGSYDFYVETPEKKYMIRPSFNYIEGQMDGYKADVLFLGVAGLAKADEAMEKKFFEETVAKVEPSLVIPLHWDNFFSGLDKPVVGMPSLIEKTEVVFYKLAGYCEAQGVSCLVQIPRTSIEV